MIAIVGAGKFGQAVSRLLEKHEHFFVDVMPGGGYGKEDLDRLGNAERVILCVPSQALEDCLKALSGIINPAVPVLSCVKGIYDGLLTPSEVIRRFLRNPVAALMGPNLSVEIMLGRPASAAFAGEGADEWAGLFSSRLFKTFVERDLVSIEFGGAIKNIVALGAGLLDGFYWQNACNAIGSFAGFALRDIERLYAQKSNARIPQTSFIGDLFATCVSETSRNHRFGHDFGTALREKSALPVPEETVEGYRTLQIVHDYAKSNGLMLPVIDALYNVFFKHGNIEGLIESWS